MRPCAALWWNVRPLRAFSSASAPHRPHLELHHVETTGRWNCRDFFFTKILLRERSQLSLLDFVPALLCWKEFKVIAVEEKKVNN